MQKGKAVAMTTRTGFAGVFFLCVTALVSLTFSAFSQSDVLYDFEEEGTAWVRMVEHAVETRCETTDQGRMGKRALAVSFDKQKQARILVRPKANWSEYTSITFDVFGPKTLSSPVEAVVYVKDRDYWWYQRLLEQQAAPGRWAEFKVDFASSKGVFPHVGHAKYFWQSVGHEKPWDPYNLMMVREFGIILFCDEPVAGDVLVDTVTGHRPLETPPETRIIDFRIDRPIVPQYGKFEARFQLNRTYANPFDPDVIDISATFTSPTGGKDNVFGFFTQDYRRLSVDGFQKLLPEGDPYWAIRYAPMETGQYTYTLTVKDAYGSFVTGPREFRSAASGSKGFIKTSTVDGRWFEYSNGEFFYPVGHSVHSPIDEHYHRMQKMPLPAPDYRTFYYDGIFPKMAANSENITELWMAPWVFELEWTDRWGGYAGLGRYNMERAWEMDYMVRLAEKYGINLQIALTNHGQLSETTDIDWEDSPYNVRNGGFLKSTVEFFSDEKAMKYHRQKLRYIIARWAYTTHIFGWVLISESDLVGTAHDFSRTPQVVNWMKVMSQYIHSIDYVDHPVTNHYFGDYSRGIPAVFSLPSIDYVACDAYCNGQDFIELVRDTGKYDSRYGKPVLITEYGLDWCGGSDNLMKAQLHAGMWSAWMTEIAGTPMFWWHIFIDDHDQYFNFKAFAKFIEGEDRRGEEMQTEFIPVRLSRPTSESFRCLARKGKDKAYLWVYNPRSCPQTSYWENFKYFRSETKIVDREWEFSPTPGLVVELKDMDPIEYDVEIWDTYTGEIVEKTRIVADESGLLTLPLTPVERDAAVKVKAIQSSR